MDNNGANFVCVLFGGRRKICGSELFEYWIKLTTVKVSGRLQDTTSKTETDTTIHCHDKFVEKEPGTHNPHVLKSLECMFAQSEPECRH